MKGLIPRIAYGLVAILLIAAILLTLGQRETYARPLASSYNPSGLHAFQELLGRNGIPSRIDRLEQPRLKPTDLVIAAYIDDDRPFLSESPLKPIEKALMKFIEGGGRVLVLPFDQDFRARSHSAIKATTPIVSSLDGSKLEVNSAPLNFSSLTLYRDQLSSGGSYFLPFDYESNIFASWFKRDLNSTDVFVANGSVGKGILARTSDGLFATNRFIDRADNATLALQLVRGLLPEGGQVVFAEASLGGGISPSLVNILGPWASGMWVQLTVLFVVVVFTLGIRFGLPAVERRAQRGQREMIDAISDVYLRAKSTAVALDVAYEEADRRIRRSLKLPAHLSVQDRDRLLPPELVSVMEEVDLGRKPIIEVDSNGKQKVTYRMNPKEALALNAKLEAALDEFIPRTGNRLS